MVLTLIGAGAAIVWQPPPQDSAWLDGMPPVAQLADKTVPLTGPPTRLRIPAIDLDAPLGPLHMDKTRQLEAPADFQKPGWYAEGTPPGDVGPAVIAGHLDSLHGKAIFYRLPELKTSDVILVQRDGKWLTFQVVSTTKFAKSRFPTAEVYGPTPDAQLRLITCGGSFDAERKSYRDNVVVFAVAT
jgi:LPXTG-site transpeptidase (sortase) family protein